jgi:hypothetical protein
MKARASAAWSISATRWWVERVYYSHNQPSPWGHAQRRASGRDLGRDHHDTSSLAPRLETEWGVPLDTC